MDSLTIALLLTLGFCSFAGTLVAQLLIFLIKWCKEK